MQLKNKEASEEDMMRQYQTAVAYVMSQSSKREAQFGHFITIHLFLLPAHAALLGRDDPKFGFVYSVLVAMLGIIICLVSYRRIGASFAKVDAAYKLVHAMEEDLPYRFFCRMHEMMGEQDQAVRQKRWFPQIRLRHTELVFHWIIGSIYASLPLLYYNMDKLAGMVE
jgi:hypothetical protein